MEHTLTFKRRTHVLPRNLEPAVSEMDELLREIDCCTQLGISPSAFAGPAVGEVRRPEGSRPVSYLQVRLYIVSAV